jgi:hypothetical protein
MMSLAATGNPNSPRAQSDLSNDTKTGTTMVLRDPSNVVNHPRRESCEYWSKRTAL